MRSRDAKATTRGLSLGRAVVLIVSKGLGYRASIQIGTMHDGALDYPSLRRLLYLALGIRYRLDDKTSMMTRSALVRSKCMIDSRTTPATGERRAATENGRAACSRRCSDSPPRERSELALARQFPSNMGPARLPNGGDGLSVGPIKPTAASLESSPPLYKSSDPGGSKYDD